MHEALLYQALDDSRVRCMLCAHCCRIAPGERGKCGVRLNRGGRLDTLVYGRAAALNIDPIEKKPLYHFLPGTLSLSVGTLGCNFRCPFCQNWEISQAYPVDNDHYDGVLGTPAELTELCLARRLPSVSFTYNEPTVFLEYALDTARLAHAHGLRTAFVTNGYQSRQALSALDGVLDAMNVDLKSFSDTFYSVYCGARLKPVLATIERALRQGIWVEVTTLVIPGLNDSTEELRSLARFLASLSPSLPWHATAFHPDNRMRDRPATPVETLLRASDIGHEAGLHFVYTGNIHDPRHSKTHCPGCGAKLIERGWHCALANRLAQGACPDCDTHIAGVWQ